MCGFVLCQHRRQQQQRFTRSRQRVLPPALPLVESQENDDDNRGLLPPSAGTDISTCSSARRMFVTLEESTASMDTCHIKENPVPGTVSELDRCTGSSACCSGPVGCFMPDLIPLSDCVHLRCEEQKAKFAQIGAQLRAISDTFERHRKHRQTSGKTGLISARLLLISDTVSLVQILRSFARTTVIPYLHLLSGLYWVYP